MKTARHILNSLGKDDKVQTNFNVVSYTAIQVKSALELKGYVVDESIGQSGFKCNLGTKKTVSDKQYAI